MNTTLLDQITHAQKHLRQLQDRIAEQEQLIRVLEDLRAECNHTWGVPVKGYEHEGVLCTKCGINDMYAPTHKRMVESARRAK